MTRTLRSLATVIGGIVALLVPLSAHAGERATVVELFTSQGCSSCPPADAYLLELLARQGSEGLIILGYHVDIWDYLGWADTLGDPAMTARQQGYIDSLALPSKYTPQMVVGGSLDVIGSNRQAVESMLDLDQAARIPGPGDVWFDDGADGSLLHVTQGDFQGTAEVWLVMYGEKEEVEILRGENAGKVIVYGNVVKRVELLGEWNGRDMVYVVPDYVRQMAGVDACVALVQMPGQGTILATAHLPLPNLR